MAVNEPQVFYPTLPQHLDPGTMKFLVDRASDSLIVFFYGPSSRPTVEMPVSDYEYLRVDAETEEVVGLHVEDLFSHAVYHNWSYLLFAELAGIDAEEIAATRERVEAHFRALSEEERRRQLVEEWLHYLQMGQRTA